MKRAFRETITEVVDSQTGEVISQTSSKHFIIKTSPDKFYQTYLNFMAPVLGVTKGNDFKVLCGLMFFVEFDTDKVSLTPEKRKELETLVSLKTQTVSNALNNLKKLKLVTGNRGDYRIDPKVLWLGSINTRTALLKSEDGLNVNLKFQAE